VSARACGAGNRPAFRLWECSGDERAVLPSTPRLGLGPDRRPGATPGACGRCHSATIAEEITAGAPTRNSAPFDSPRDQRETLPPGDIAGDEPAMSAPRSGGPRHRMHAILGENNPDSSSRVVDEGIHRVWISTTRQLCFAAPPPAGVTVSTRCNRQQRYRFVFPSASGFGPRARA